MKNQGISLITLIITIIVIIILAAIVIFTGLRTPDSAQFSAFTNDVDTVYTAMIDKFADLKVEHAVKGDYRTNEQIYIELATGSDLGQYVVMSTNTLPSAGANAASITGTTTHCQRIHNGVAGDMGSSYTASNSKLGITLPKVRQKTDSWYVTDDGRIFNATGFEYNGNIYWNASYYTKDPNHKITTKNSDKRAEKIAAAMQSTANFVVSDADSIDN